MTTPTGSPETAESTLVLLFLHKAWATVRLIEACHALAPEHLAATTPGTYGSIHATLQHLVGADESYCHRVSGRRPYPEMAADTDLVPLEQLAARTTAVAGNWEMVAADTGSHGIEVVTNDGWRLPRMVIIAQALHHADEHRAQVLSIIGAHGFGLPGIDIGQDFDVWHLGIDSGMMQKVGGKNAS